jgi:hypothetical protein
MSDKSSKPYDIDALAELGKQASETLRPIDELGRGIAQLLMPHPELAEAIRKFTESQQQIAENLCAAVQVATHQLGGIFEDIRTLGKEAQLLKDAGYLPHVTMPERLIKEANGDAKCLSASVAHYYQDNWSRIEGTLIKRIDAYYVDEEAKAVFREAMAGYRIGHFRSVVRLLFPEIERVARTLSDQFNTKGQKPHQVLQDAAGSLCPSDVGPGGIAGLALFERLLDLYAQVDVRRMARDPVPYRNASLHGLIIYKSPQNALNTIFMTDYAFQIVDVVRRRPRASDGSDNAS